MISLFVFLQFAIVPDIQAMMDAEEAMVADVNEAQVVIGARTTEFRVRGKYRNRARNIHRASRAINGTVIQPGETFSFNEVVGPRTIRRGYRRAPAILRGELGESVGGGVCQVASTIFAAALEAGMEFIEATPHTRYMTYIDPGYDATVFYGSKDFRFRNPFDFPITIHTQVDGNQLTVEFYGNHRVYDVEITIDEIVRYGREIIRHRNSSLPTGRCRVIERGTDALRLRRSVRFTPTVAGYLERSWISDVRYESSVRILECNR
jgi:vancomycin resistance protein YoaR